MCILSCMYFYNVVAAILSTSLMWIQSYSRISDLVCYVLIICLIKRKSTLEAVMPHENLHMLLALGQLVPCLGGGHRTGAGTC